MFTIRTLTLNKHLTPFLGDVQYLSLRQLFINGNPDIFESNYIEIGL